MSSEHHVDWPAVAERASRFDLLLVAIPVALAVGFSSGRLLSVPLFFGWMGGAAAAATLIGYGVYAVGQVDTTD